MNKREQNIKSAREQLSDIRLLNFLTSAFKSSGIGVSAVRFILQHFEKGESFDSIFYTGDDYGYNLSVKAQSANRYTIHFGCVAGPLAGDGGRWQVTFNTDDSVKTIRGGMTWIS